MIRFGWLALWAGVILCALFCRPLLPVDETRYMSVAWEMWQGGQWLVPHSNGIPYSHKPPLLFWLIHLGWLIFGVNEWSARLAAPLFGLFTIFLTKGLARMLFPEQEKLNLLVPYLFLGTLFWNLYSTMTRFEMLVSFFAVMSWMSLWKACNDDKRSWLFLYGISIGFGILAKGPVIFLYSLPLGLLAPWWANKDRPFPYLKWYSGITASLLMGGLLALAWAVPAAWTGGQIYREAIFFSQTAGRVIHSFAHQHPVYWYLVLIPLLFFPWSLYFPVKVAFRKSNMTSPVKFCLGIICPGIFLFSIISGKQIHYLLPFLPASVLLVGHGFLLNKKRWASRRWIFPVFLFLFFLALLAMPFIPLGERESQMAALAPCWFRIGILLAVPLSLLLEYKSKDPVVTMAVIVSGILMFVHISFMPLINTFYALSDTDRLLNNADNAGRPVMVFPNSLDDQLQFAGRLTRPVEPMRSMAEAMDWCRVHPEGLAVLYLRKDKYRDLILQEKSRLYRGRWLVLISARELVKYKHGVSFGH